MNEWKECKLGDVAELFDGPHATPKKTSSGPVFLGISSLNSGKIEASQFEYISENDFARWTKRVVPQQGDIVFSYETKLGEAAIIPAGLQCCLGRRLGMLRPKNSVVDSYFLLYYYLGPIFQNVIHERTIHGTTVDRLPLIDMPNFPVFIPPLPEQKAIAAVLSSLDDKIDLLHRQNKTLEAMAETLFRQWFVEEADEGWEEVPLEFVANRITDGSHASPPSTISGKPMASVKDMYDWGIDLSTCRRISENDFNKLVQDDCMPLKNDILIAKDGSYLKHIFVVREKLDLVVLSSIAIIRPNGKYHPILLSILLKMDSTLDLLKNIVTGAVIPRIVLKDFKKFPVVLPPSYVQERALEKIKPIVEKCWINDTQIRTLEKLRDTLLPKLMSGEVRVEL